MSYFKAKNVIIKNATNLFGTNWLDLFDIWNLPINLYGKNINDCPSRNNSCEELKRKF